MGRIVVGVDGSAGSIEALRWALGEAQLRGATLRAVTAWTYPGLAMLPFGAAPPTPPDVADRAAEILDKALAEAGAAATDVAVERVVVESSVMGALLHEAEAADLVVVGARGLGGFRGLLLGSVSQQCAQHARCPVVIVHSSA